MSKLTKILRVGVAAALLMGASAAGHAANLALGQPAVASSTEVPQFSPDMAVDGNGATRWSSNHSDNEWIYVDLGGTFDVDRVVLNWETAFGSGYQIQVSNDASTWNTIFTETSGDGGIDDISFAPVSTRYVRMLGTARGTQWGYSLFEFEVHGEGDPPVFTSIVVSPASATVETLGTQAFTAEGRDQFGDPIALPGPVTWSVPAAAGTIDTSGVFTAGSTEGGPHTVTATVNAVNGTAQVTVEDSTPSGNLALGQPAFASSTEAAQFPPGSAVDGNLGTRWSSNHNDNEWIYVDLGANYNVNRVVLQWETAFGSAYLIQVSDDASSWTTVFTEASGDGGLDDITFASTSARYVRMLGTDRGTQWGYSLFEFEVYGNADPPMFTSIIVTPASVNVPVNTTQQFNAEGRDQFGNPIALPGPVTWSVPPAAGGIDSGGLFTAAGTAGGPFTVTATVSAVNGTAQVTVTDPPVFTSIVVTPATATVDPLGTVTFSAEGRDQFGDPIALPGPVSWSVPAAAGSIDSAGLFTAGSTEGGPHTVTATVNTVNGTAQVTIEDSTPAGNLALGQPAVASSTEVPQFSPDQAVDGNLGTRWSSARTDNEWIYVDLGAGYNINRVVLRWETAFGSGYLIQVSNDATNWTTVFTEASGDGGVDDITFAASSARYVRMFGTDRGTQWGYSLFEFEVYGTADPPVFTSIVVTPATVDVPISTTQQFNAEGRDQFGDPIALPGAVVWSVPPAAGGIDSSGLFTAAGSAGGPFTVTATVGAVNGTAQVTVTDPPVFTSIVVSPATATVEPLGTVTFTAEGRDQFDNPIALPGPVSWSVPGAAGSINSSGLFTAGATEGGPHTVTATVNTVNGTAQVTIDDSTPTGNLALGRPAFASSTEVPQFSPDLAVDGNLATRWSSARTDNEWIYVDLGTSYNINRVVLRWEAAFGSGYLIQVSSDASSWTTVFTETSGNGGVDDLSFAATSARYVRMLGTARGTQWGYSLFEFEVYGVTSGFSLPFTDDFNDGNSAGWAFVDEAPAAGSWSVVSSRLQQSAVVSSTFAFEETYHLGTIGYYLEGMTLDDYEYTVTATYFSTNLSDSLGIVFRYQDPMNYYRVTVNARYGFTRLEKQVAGVFTTLATDARGYLLNTPVDLTARVFGSDIVITIDGEEVFAVTDASLATGSFGVFAQDGTHFDDVMVIAPPTSPDVTLSTPIAYGVDPGSNINATALAHNVPGGGYVEFLLNGGSSQTDFSAPYSATFASPGAGNHTVEAVLRDSGGTELDRDTNVLVGVLGRYMVAIGDSITNGIGDRKRSDNISTLMRVVASQGYESHLTDLLDGTGTPANIVFNDGIAGDRTQQILEKIDNFIERHPDMETMLILLGTNDALSSIPSGLGCAGAACNGTFKGNLQAIVDNFRFDDYPTNSVPSGVTVYVARVMPAFFAGTPWTSGTNNRIRDYNTVIETEIAGISLGPDFFDYFLPSATENYASLFSDTLHPNSLGHVIQGELWHNSIRGLSNDPFKLENLTVSVANAPQQSVLENGDVYTTDLTNTLTGYSATFEDGRWLLLANSDFGNTSANYVQFDVDRSTTVYVAFDAGATTLPAWLDTPDWTLEGGLSVTTTNPAAGSYTVYSRTYAASNTVTIGGASQAPAAGVDANLIVIAVEN